MAPRSAIVAFVVLALVAGCAYGCGGSAEDERAEDRAGVEALVDRLNAAIVAKDPAGWCRVFSPSSIEGAFGSVARCRRETERVLESGGSPQRLEVADIAFVDDTARVTFEGRAGDANLVLENGKWYFSLDQLVQPDGQEAPEAGEGQDGS